jgi:Undecaprenyl-phosphate glucose phosphotransferase
MSVETSNPIAQSAAEISVAVTQPDALPEQSARTGRLSLIVGYSLVADFLTVAASAYATSAIYHYAASGILPHAAQYITAAIYIATLFTVISVGFRHFSMLQRQRMHTLLWNGIGAVALTFAFFLSTIFLLKAAAEYSRATFVFQIFGVSTAVCITRVIFYLWIRSGIDAGSIEARRVILIGENIYNSRLIGDLKANGIRIAGQFSLPKQFHEMTSTDDKSNELDPHVRQLIDFCRSVHPDDIVVFSAQKDLGAASNLVRYFSELPCNVHIAPIGTVNFLSRSQIVDLGGVMTLQVSRPPLSLVDLALKRAFDVVAATAGLIALSPLLLIVGLIIKLDSPGPVLFRQMRHGYNNKTIRVFKFRTMMTVDNGADPFTPAKVDDARVTSVGRVLRRTNIDELPQLLNVLIGDMSIVGPRPHATIHNRMFVDQLMPFARRHNVKPGITGWAQVNGYRGAADTIGKMRRRVEFDLYYIDNWTFILDLRIILMTLFSKKAYTNAY